MACECLTSCSEYEEFPVAKAISEMRKENERLRSVREPVQWFAEQMERKLKKHDPDVAAERWVHWQDAAFPYLHHRFNEESGEFARALASYLMKESSASALIDEAADVANFAMMIADKIRAVLAAADGEVKP